MALTEEQFNRLKELKMKQNSRAEEPIPVGAFSGVPNMQEIPNPYGDSSGVGQEFASMGRVETTSLSQELKDKNIAGGLLGKIVEGGQDVVEGLGRGITSALTAKDRQKVVQETSERLVSQQQRLVDRLKEERASGLDTSKTEELLSTINSQINELKGGAEDFATGGVTPNEVIGSGIRTAGTILSAGELGRLTTMPKSGGLFKRVSGGALATGVPGGIFGFTEGFGQGIEEGESFGSSLQRGLVGGGIGLGVGSALGGALGAGSAIAASRGGISQFGRQLNQRGRRVIQRIGESVDEASQRAARIAKNPEYKNVIREKVDDRLINAIDIARKEDPATLRGYKEIVDIAEEGKDALGTATRPEIVAGRVVEDQYKLIDKQRREVGSQIGEAFKNLSDELPVDMTDGFKQIDDVLGGQGVSIQMVDGKRQFNFSGSNFTPAERGKIEELYKLAQGDGSAVIDPSTVFRRNQLFSKLQRESRFEGIGDIIVETPQGNRSLFSVFKDQFNNKLDEVSPDDIRNLNSQYRQLISLQNDIDNTLVKSGNLEAAKGVDPSEFAQTRLRRLLSDAQSAAEYRAVTAQLDEVARQLGYEGANAQDLIAFATEIRNLYKTSIPPTSFTGGINTSVGGAVDAVLKAGKANVKDKQKALRELLTELVEDKSTSGVNLPIKAIAEASDGSDSLLKRMAKDQTGRITIPGGNSSSRKAKGNVKKSFSKSNTRPLTPEVKDNIVRIIDDYELKGGKNLSLQEDAAKIAEDFGIKMPKNYGNLVRNLRKALEESPDDIRPLRKKNRK